MGIYFGTDGLRGIYGEVISPSIAYKVGNSLAHQCKTKQIILGRDTRRSSDILSLSFASGIMSQGVNVIDVGTVPTPVVAYLAKLHKFDFGVVISASHNPKNYNGIKIFDCDGYKISEELEAEIERKIIYSTEVGGDKVGKYCYRPTLVREYKKNILSEFPDLCGLKIILDMANGASYQIARDLFSRAGAKILPLNYSNSGKKINLKCGALYPEVISQAVQDYGADMGFAFDGDADRIIACDENGKIIDGDDILYVLSKKLKSGDKVVGTSMTNKGLEEALKKRGINLLRADVGDKYVVKEMKNHSATVGGEPAGHIINSKFSTTGDGVLTAMMIASIAKTNKKPLSKIANLKHFPQVNINVEVVDKYRLLNSDLLSSEILKAQKECGQNGRILVRASGTENKIRIMSEHKNPAKAELYAKRLEKIVKNIEKTKT